jgi:hypothetical protein
MKTKRHETITTGYNGYRPLTTATIELRCAEIRWFYKRKEDTKRLAFQG